MMEIAKLTEENRRFLLCSSKHEFSKQCPFSEKGVGDHGIYPMAMMSSSDVAADVGCHHVTQRKRKVAEISKFENSIQAFSNCDTFF